MSVHRKRLEAMRPTKPEDPKAAEARAVLQERQKELKRCLNAAFSSHEGKVALYWLMKQCGYDLADAVFSPTGEFLPESSMFNLARRGIYVELRKHLHREILAAVELPQTPDGQLDLFKTERSEA